MADRICGKRLKAMIPTSLASMTRYGRLLLADELRDFAGLCDTLDG